MVTINTSDDLLRALRENPEWKEAVRREILTEELMNLPARFDKFVGEQRQFNDEQRRFNDDQRQFNDDQRQFNDDQRQFNDDQRRFTEEQRQINDDQRRFNDDQRQFNDEQRQFNDEQRQFNDDQRQFNEEQMQTNSRLEDSIARLDRSVDRIRRDIGNMRAVHARTETTREAGVIVGDMGYTLIRILTPDDLSAMAANGDISDLERGELISFRRGDLIMEVATTDGATHYIAMEISYTADERDTSRAIRNAGLLTRFTGHPAHAAIASIRNVYEIQHFIDSGQVYWHPLPDRDEPAE